MMTRTLKRIGIRGRRGKGFTIIELLVAVSIMTLIVFVLYSVFDQTQKAMRSNVSQVDVLEGGRAAMEMLVRDLSLMTRSDVPDMSLLDSQGNVIEYRGCTNFHVQLSEAPVFQKVPGIDPEHTIGTNAVQMLARQEFFFLTRPNKDWVQIGYYVKPTYADDPMLGVSIKQLFGRLYRFEMSVSPLALNRSNYTAMTTNYMALLDNFRLAPTAMNTNLNMRLSEFSAVVDGVVHLRVQAYDADGRLLASAGPFETSGLSMESFVPVTGLRDVLTLYRFRNHYLPSYVEVELGILEPQVAERLKTIPDPNRAMAYLSEQAARTHIFRQRIPIRSAQ